jgi:hypothetical protein
MNGKENIIYKKQLIVTHLVISNVFSLNAYTKVTTCDINKITVPEIEIK